MRQVTVGRPKATILRLSLTPVESASIWALVRATWASASVSNWFFASPEHLPTVAIELRPEKIQVNQKSIVAPNGLSIRLSGEGSLKNVIASPGRIFLVARSKKEWVLEVWRPEPLARHAVWVRPKDPKKKYVMKPKSVRRSLRPHDDSQLVTTLVSGGLPSLGKRR